MSRPEIVWREGAWCSGCHQPSRVLLLDAERMLQAARNGGWSARYGSVAEREHLRQAVYRAARAAGVEVETRSEGGRVGVLHVRARSGSPRPQGQGHVPECYREAQARDERGDLEAIRELVRTVRAQMAEAVIRARRPACAS